MRLKTFTAPDMNRAMLMIRETMGDDAVIISTARDGNGKSVSVTAAVDDGFAEEAPSPSATQRAAERQEEQYEQELEDSAPEYPVGGLGQYLAATAASKKKSEAQVPRKDITAQPAFMNREALWQNRDLAYWLNELEQVLNFHSVPQDLTERMLKAAKHLDISAPRTLEGVGGALADLLSQMFAFSPLDLADAQSGHAARVMLIGPPGTGKTLAVAKIAADLVAEGLPVHVVSIDNKRAGSVEQLRAFTHIMGFETELADSRNELRQLLRECPANEPVIIDAFGTNPYSYDELKELTDFANLHEVEPLLVLAAGGDAQEAADIAQAFAFLSPKRLLVTRSDTVRRLGAILSAADAAGLALCNVTNSPQVAGGFMPMNADTLSKRLMRHKTDH